MKLKELVMKIFANTVSRIIAIAVIVGVVLLIVVFNKNDKVDTTYILTQLEKASELTTAKLNFTGMTEYKDDGLVVLNKSNFKMVYKATARAGIDVKEVKIDVDDFNKVVWLTIPKAKILDVKVDMESIKYFDEKFSLFNFNSKDDANKANAQVEKGAIEELENMGILEMANNQAEALIKGLIQDSVPKNYEIKVK